MDEGVARRWYAKMGERMKRCQCRFSVFLGGLGLLGFLGLFCRCALADCCAVEECGDAPDAIWMRRIESDHAKRHSLLQGTFAEGVFAIEMDYFRVGKYMNFFVTVGVSSNKIGLVVQRDVGANAIGANDLDIVTTNLFVNIPEGVLLDLRDGLRKYKYHQHAGSNAGWVRVSTIEDGAEVVRWFDRPGWPRQKDQEVLRTIEFARRTESEEVWRRFLGVYRAITLPVNDVIKALDQITL